MPFTVTIAGVQPRIHANDIPAGTAFTTNPFSTYFGASIDPSFTNLQGQLTADLNGDGAPDLLVYGAVDTGASPSPVRIQSFVSNGKGGFSAGTPQQLTLPAAPSANVGGPISPAAIDVDGDGKLDLLIGTALAHGNGDGTFAQPTTPSFLASGFGQTFAADITGDGKADILAVNPIASETFFQPGNVPLAVTVLANQGGGNFKSLGAFTLGAAQAASITLASLSLADLNNDGKPDLVAQIYFLLAGNAETPATITAALNKGDGTFAAAVPVNYTAQQNGGSIELLSVQAADFNRDNKIDLALVYPPPMQSSLTYPSSIIFLPGNGDGTFGAEMDSTITTTVQAGATSAQPPAGNAVVNDANLDGAPDLVFGSGAVAQGDGKGNFTMGTPLVQVPIPSGSGAIGYINAASLGSIQPPANTAPDLVFAAVANATPFPLVEVSNAAALTVQSNGSSPSVTVTSGQSATASLSVAGPASYSGSVALTCTGLLANATCSFQPATLSLSGGAAQSSTLTIATNGGAAAMARPSLGFGMTTMSCGVFAGSLLLLWPKRRHPYIATMMILALAGFVLVPLGCGGNSSSSGTMSNNTPSGTYNFQVVATAGAKQTATSCTLVVQ